MTAAQLVIPLPHPTAPPPDPHPWSAPVPDAQIGACTVCGLHQLDPAHRRPTRAAEAFFDALDRADRDGLLVARQVIRRCRDDLTRLAADPDHDEGFRSGVAWGHAALGMVDAALAGEREPSRLSFSALRRRVQRRRTTR